MAKPSTLVSEAEANAVQNIACLQVVFKVLADTGANCSVTPFEMDFTGPIRPCRSQVLRGLAKGLAIEGYGEVKYVFQLDTGKYNTVTITCACVTDATRRLLSPQAILKAGVHW